MPIAGPAIKSGLQSGFASGATTFAAAAMSWANAISSGTASIVPPSTTVSAAATALQGQLATAFASNSSPPYSIPAMEAAFTAFGAAVGLGMLPLYAAVPPAGPVGFSSLFSSTYSTHSDAAQAISDAIVTWLQTGTASLVAPPNTVVPWS